MKFTIQQRQIMNCIREDSPISALDIVLFWPEIGDLIEVRRSLNELHKSGFVVNNDGEWILSETGTGAMTKPDMP